MRSRRRGVSRRGQRGLTLVEIMVTIAIIAIVTVALSNNVMGVFTDSKAKTTEIQLGQVGQSLTMYVVRYGDYPAELGDLVRPPSGAGYLKAKQLKDPWGRALVYRRPGANGAPFDLRSMGADGLDETDDDIALSAE